MTAEDDAGLAWDALQRFSDPASGMFDAVLDAANLEPRLARALRFWQRESVHSVKQYAAHTLPAIFLTLAQAQDDARAAAVRAEQTLRAGVRGPAGTPATIVLPDAVPHDAGTLLDERRRAVAARLAQAAEG